MSLAEGVAAALNDGKAITNGDNGFICKCPVHDDTEASLSVWDSSASEDDVRVHCHAGCDYKDVKDYLRLNKLIPEWKKKNGSETKAAAKKKKPKPVARVEKDSFIWKKSIKDEEKVSKYLESRGIAFSDDFPFPPSLKWNEYSDKEGKHVELIVAAATFPDDKSVKAIQRLFMDDYKKTGSKMLGDMVGRGVWFYRKRIAEEELIIGEGIETTLSAMQVTGKNGVACLTVAGLQNIVIPPEVKTIYILSDSDNTVNKKTKKLTYPGQKAAIVLAKKFESSGGVAHIVSPDDSCFTDNPQKLDFNDLLQQDRSGKSIADRFKVICRHEDINLPEEAEAPTEDHEEKKAPDGDGFYPDKTILALEELNKVYASALLSGGFRVLKEGYDNTAKKHTLSFLKFGDFSNHMANLKSPVFKGSSGDVKYLPLAKIWLEWAGRRTYDDVVFAPDNNPPKGSYNLFRGFPLTPKKGDWSKMEWHLRRIICNGDEEIFKYVMAWMARAIQNPGGRRPGVAIVMKGGKGIGKGQFADYFGKLFGDAYLPISDADSFTGKFNMHLSKTLFVFLDEAVWGGNKKAEGRLKALITEPTVMFEPKGIDSMAMRNYMNILIASNEDWVIPATGDERRFLVLRPNECKKGDIDYFGELADERRGGGCEAMMYDLLRYDYSDVSLRKAPKTDELAGQVEQSLHATHQFWHSVLSRGFMLSDTATGAPKKSTGVGGMNVNDLWPDYIWKYEMYEEYLNWSRKVGNRYPSNEVWFWKKLWEVWPHGKPSHRIQRMTDKGAVLDKIMLHPHHEGTESFTKATGISFDTSETVEDFDGQF